MSNKIDLDDIVMKDNFDNGCDSYHNYFSRNFKNYTHKRNYLDMLKNSNMTLVNNRVENLKLISKNLKTDERIHGELNIDDIYNKKDISNTNTDLIKEINNYSFSSFNQTKKNLIIKKPLIYDEENEKKWVENYYRIKNAELNKLRFGNE